MENLIEIFAQLLRQKKWRHQWQSSVYTSWKFRKVSRFFNCPWS